jgi:hypothetical protein
LLPLRLTLVPRKVVWRKIARRKVLANVGLGIRPELLVISGYVDFHI